MKRFRLILAAAASLAFAGPALAACKNAAGQAVKCRTKPVVSATTQASSAVRPAAKTCVVNGKRGPCKVKSHETDFSTRQNLRW